MKNFTKRALSVFLMLMMLMTMAISAFAVDPTGTLTVNGTAAAVGKTVNVYKIFDLTVTGTPSNYDYTIAADYVDFFATQYAESLTNKADHTVDAVLNEETYNAAIADKKAEFTAKSLDEQNEWALAYTRTALTDVTEMTHSATSKPYANALMAYIEAKNLTANGTGTMAAVAGEGNENKSSAQIADLPYGEYVVFAGRNPASLVSVGADTATINIKADYPTVNKTVADADEAAAKALAANIGQVVNFKLESTVPDTDGYESYTFMLHDTMSEGLTFNADSVVVKVGGNTLTVDDDYTVDTTDPRYTFTIDLSGKIMDLVAEAAIEVTYSATVNENAVTITSDPNANTNSAVVEYTTEPGETETSTPSVTKVYTFEIDINKTAKTEGDITAADLIAGAKFKLHKDAEDGEVVKLVAVADEINTVYRVAKADETTGVVEEVETVAGKKLIIKGLDQGTYYLEETAAPAGYNKLQSPIPVVISATIAADGSLTTWSVKVGNADAQVMDANVVVVNKKGTELPSTGAIGTAIFAVAGVALVIGGTQILGRKKKEEEAE